MAAYVYSDDRKNERPIGHLAGFRGVLQVDGYNGFKALAGTRTDANLVNGWGIAHGATGPWWVSAAERGLSIAYDGAGNPAAPNVAIPPVPGDTDSKNFVGIAVEDFHAGVGQYLPDL